MRCSVGFDSLPECVSFNLVLLAGVSVIHLRGVLEGSLGVSDDHVLDDGVSCGGVASRVFCLQCSKSSDHCGLGGGQSVRDSIGFGTVVSSSLLHGVCWGARPVFVRTVEKCPSFVPVVWGAGVVVHIACICLSNRRVQFVDCVSDHAHVCGELSDTLVSNGVRGSGEIASSVHGSHDVGINGARLVVICIVAVVLTISGCEAS